MDYTVKQAQKIFEKLIADVHKGKKVFIVDGETRCQLLPMRKRPNRTTPNPK